MSAPDEEEIKAKFEEVFNEISGGDGKITHDDLKKALEKGGVDATDDQIAAIIEAADKDNTGYIGFEDFVEVILSAQFAKMRIAAAFRMFFQAVDPEGTGMISVDQIKEAAKKYDLASKLPPERVEEIKDTLADAEGQVSYEEFLTKLKEKLEEEMG